MDVPDSHYLLGLLHNINLHWKQGRDYGAAVASLATQSGWPASSKSGLPVPSKLALIQSLRGPHTRLRPGRTRSRSDEPIYCDLALSCEASPPAARLGVNRATAELGRFIREFRLAHRLTQQQLAAQVGTSRSAIALMEQGRRLLPSRVLTVTASSLGIPSALVEPFLSTAIQAYRNKSASAAPSEAPFSTLCVSGISGAGKTTLAEVLVRSYGATRIGSDAHGRRYLPDLTSDATRWAFETQVAFLVSKTAEIRRRIEEGSPIVIERWIGEDIEVYERHFYEQKKISERSHETFLRIAQAQVETVPMPEYIIYCKCAAETALERTQRRQRGDSELHSRPYIEATLRLYERWLDGLSGPEVFVLDTDNSDLSDPAILSAVFSEVEWALTNDIRDPQIPLFGDVGGPSERLRHLLPYRSDRWRRRRKSQALASRGATPLLSPIAYLAAPFTGFDTGATLEIPQQELFEDARAHGVIPRGGFRAHLLSLERALQSLGLAVVLPHRDVNDWGNRLLTPEDALATCTNHVAACDVFIGILGASCGAHYEFGLAFAQGKPCVLLGIGEVKSSFLAAGAAVLSSTDVLFVQAGSFRDAASRLGSLEVRNFLARHIGERYSLG